jgi:hypothetical protein
MIGRTLHLGSAVSGFAPALLRGSTKAWFIDAESSGKLSLDQPMETLKDQKNKSFSLCALGVIATPHATVRCAWQVLSIVE